MRRRRRLPDRERAGVHRHRGRLPRRGTPRGSGAGIAVLVLPRCPAQHVRAYRQVSSISKLPKQGGISKWMKIGKFNTDGFLGCCRQPAEATSGLLRRLTEAAEARSRLTRTLTDFRRIGVPTIADTGLDPFASIDRRFVSWWKDKDTGRKILYDPQRSRAASSTDPDTWGTRAQAERRSRHDGAILRGGRQGGIGIVLGDMGNGVTLAGLDLNSAGTSTARSRRGRTT